MSYPILDLSADAMSHVLEGFRADLLTGSGALEELGQRAQADIVRMQVDGAPLLLWLRHPDLVRDVLLQPGETVTKARRHRLMRMLMGDGLITSEVPLHTRNRKLVMPAFHHSQLGAYARVMVEETERLAERWEQADEVDLTAEMNHLALEVATRTLFGGHVDRSALIDLLEGMFYEINASQHPLGGYLPATPVSSEGTRRTRKLLDAEVYRLIDENRRADADDPQSRGNLLSLLISARDAETGDALSDREIRDETATLLLTGYEAVAVALMWAVILIAERPAVQARLRAEADALPGPPTFADLPQLDYARRVCAEAMRVHAPVWTLSREVAQPFTLGGLDLEVGTTLLFGHLWQHHDPRFWTDPERFDPDRFLPERKRERHKFAYLPFGAGRRRCIGESMAWMEMTLVLSMLAGRFDLELAAPLPPVIATITYRPDGPVRVRPTARAARVATPVLA